MPTTYSLGKLRVNCLKTLSTLSICLPGKTPSAPSDCRGRVGQHSCLLGFTDNNQACVGYAGAVGAMLLDEVADLGAQADMTVTTVEDHSQQLGELLVMMQTMQEMMGVQQERLMRMEALLQGWAQCLVAQETTVNKRLMWLQNRLEC